MGFLKVEKNDFLHADYYFSRALKNAETRPQKIFVHFLLSRLFYLNNDFKSAEEHIGKILYIDPGCTEAIYQDIILQFRRQRNTEALRRLDKLIRNEREYFIYALIDPELADFNELIHPELNNLLNEARDEAEQTREKAQSKVEKLEAQLTQEEKEVNDPKPLWLRIAELSKSDSYFNHLDIIHYSNHIIDMGAKYLKDRKAKLFKVLNEIEPRIKRCFILSDKLPYRNLITNVLQRLKNIEAKMNRHWQIARGNDPKVLKDALDEAETLTKELKQVELELKKLNSIQQVMLFFSKFFKKSLIFQSVNLLVVFCIFPIFTHYLNFFLPDIRISTQNIWEYQQFVLVLGGLSGVCLALMLTTKTMPNE